jgi:hypothetical protein
MAPATEYSAFPPDPKSPMTSSSPTCAVVVVVGRLVVVVGVVVEVVDVVVVVTELVVEAVDGGVMVVPPVVAHPPRRITSAISTGFIGPHSCEDLGLRLRFAATITDA